ncbi:thiol:disulfide interchange protein [Methylorubrum extorquens]|uniref:Thiol:disulfide interchange protein n=1 Tax=Methylorubrum extorquens TaxID=408 RepID=A0A1S1PAI8_METEX|nr:thiol:disulfide interchange protein [Methylorubrum extorquens]
MNAISLGPMVLAPERLAVLAGIGVFLGTAWALAPRLGRGFYAWATWTVVAAVAAARLGYVWENWPFFAWAPWRTLAVWQGGFHPAAALLGLATVSAVYLRSMRSVAAGTAAACAGLLVWRVISLLTAARLGQAAPDMLFDQLDGEPLAISDLRGRPAIVNVWATWCPPCRSEMPTLALAASAQSAVAFAFVNQGEGADRIRAYLATSDLSLPHVLLDRSTELPRYYGTRGIPVTLFLRADGTLADMHTGAISQDVLAAGIARLLRQP